MSRNNVPGYEGGLPAKGPLVSRTEFSLKDAKPETIAKKMEDVLAMKDVPNYPLERHGARVVQRLYELYRSMTTPTCG